MAKTDNSSPQNPAFFFVSWLSHFERYLAIASTFALSILMMLAVIDVVGRGLFNTPLEGAHELSGSMMVAMVFLGLAYVQAQKRNITIDFLLTHVSEKTRAKLELFSLLCCLAICIFLVWAGWLEAYKSWLLKTEQSGPLSYVTWPVRALVPFGGAILVLRLILQVYRQFLQIRGR